jgi:hypothetical protein
MPEPAEPVRRRWSTRLRRRRTPLLIAGAGLLLGCLLGGGLVAAGFAVSDFGDQRSHDGGAGRSERGQAGPDDRNRRDHNGGGRGQRRNSGDDGPTPSPSTSAAPSPSASS